MATAHDTAPSGAGQSPLTADQITRAVVSTIAEVAGVHLGASIVRALRTAFAAVLVGHEALTEERLGRIVTLAMRRHDLADALRAAGFTVEEIERHIGDGEEQ